MTSNLIQQLKPKAHRGSKPRCHLLTHGEPAAVAQLLTALGSPYCEVTTSDHWMPMGFDDQEEAQLHKAGRLLNADIRQQLSDWWLAPASKRAMTPNWDIAATCSIAGKKGLLLVEAKAHDEELHNEAAGRRLSANSSAERKASHEQIGQAIDSACRQLTELTALPWQISRDSHYQLANRFAWASKLTELGMPVVLVYLGFLKADEMAD